MQKNTSEQKLTRLYQSGKYGKYRELSFKNGAYYDILSYITSFCPSFDEIPFGDADSLVLCQLAYTDLSDFVGKTLAEIAENMTDSKKVAPYCHDDCVKVIKALASSPRLGGIKVLSVKERLNKEEQCQYGVTLFDIGSVLYFACRGTDDHMIGWLEDIDLIYQPELRSHELTVADLNEFGLSYDKPIIVGGHSKGGNMAIFAAAFCLPEVQNKITKIYDHDGPGLMPSVMAKDGMQNVLDRIDKTCPELSVFGMIMHEGVPYRVIYSHCKDIYQHYILNWQIDKATGTLVKAEITNRPSKVIRIVVEKVLPTMTEEDRVRFRKYAAAILDGAKIEVLGDFTAKGLLSLVGQMFLQPWSEQKFMWKLLGKILKVIPAAEKEARAEIKQQKC